MGTKIKDAQLLESVTGVERIPVSDGSGNPKAVTTETLKNFVGASGGGGIPIVDSEDKLETLDLPQGSLASVAYDTLSVVSFRDMYQPTAADIDQEAGGLANPDALSSVSKLAITVPESFQSGEPNTGFYLVPRTFSATNQNIIMLTFIVGENDGCVKALWGYIVIGGSPESITLFTYDDNGVPSIDQTSIDKLNALLETDDWCYFGFPDVGFTLTEAQFDTIDKFVKAVSGISSTDLYIKGSKGWKKENPLKVSELENDKGFITQKNILSKYEFKELSGYNNVLTIKPNTITEFEYIDSSDKVVDIYLHHTEEYSEYILICNGYVSFNNSIIWKDSRPPKSKHKIIIKLVYKGEGESFFAEWLETSSVTMEFECESTTDSFNVLNTDYGNGVTNHFPVELLIVDGKEKGGFFIMSEAGKHDVVCVLPDIYDGIAQDKEITSLIIKNAKTIGKDAFKGCSKLASVTITGELTHIGDNAFYRCTSLSSITLPSSVTHIGDNAFYGCTGLTSITIPSSVTHIGDNAFYGCTGLTSIIFEGSIITVGENAFSKTNITKVYASSFTEWRQMVFDNKESNPMGGSLAAERNLYLSNSLVQSLDINADINDYAFVKCSSLNSITFKSSVSKIGKGAFEGSGLTKASFVIKGSSYYVPKLEYIGDDCFRDCKQLKNIQIPAYLKHVGDNAFNGLSLVKELLFPNSVEYFGNGNGCNCPSLEIITYPDKMDTFEISYSSSLKTVVMPDECKLLEGFKGSNIQDLFLGSKISFVSSSASSGFNKIKRLHIKDIATICTYQSLYTGNVFVPLGYIAEKFFYKGEELSILNIPDTVQVINEYAFCDIASIKEVFISNSVVKICKNAFIGTNAKKYHFGTSLQYITELPATTAEQYDFTKSLYVPVMTSSNTVISDTCKIVVPDSLYDEWIVAENWSNYASQIVKASEYVEPTNE